MSSGDVTAAVSEKNIEMVLSVLETMKKAAGPGHLAELVATITIAFEMFKRENDIVTELEKVNIEEMNEH